MEQCSFWIIVSKFSNLASATLNSHYKFEKAKMTFIGIQVVKCHNQEMKIFYNQNYQNEYLPKYLSNCERVLVTHTFLMVLV